MKKAALRTVNIQLYKIFGFFLIVAASVIGWRFFDSNDPKMAALLGGLFSGLLVYLITFVINISEYKDLDKMRSMGFHALLSNRHDTNYYRKILERCNRRVDVMGTSCSRFISDFLDLAKDDNVLIGALNNNKKLKIRLLIPKDKFMKETSAKRFVAEEDKVNNLLNEYKGRVEIKRFSDPARHSFVIADDRVIAGPIFENDESQNSPAVDVYAHTPFAKKYIEYFDSVWALTDNEVMNADQN